MAVQVRDVLTVLDRITNGRCIKTAHDYVSGKNPYALTRSSHIPGKAVTEMPGLVYGDLNMEIKKIAVMMTLTESAIELAAATGVNILVVHHPVADAANSGGTLIKTYFGAYKMALFELHEAFHGLHNGVPFLHGHRPFFTSTSFGGVPGNVVYVGEALPEVKTAGDLLRRLDKLMNVQADEQMLLAERKIRQSGDIQETRVAARGKILAGRPENPVRQIIHMFPHAGFTAEHLLRLVKDYPDADTLLATSSRVYPGHALINKAGQVGLNFLCGNSHAMEIYENGLPLAKALQKHLPEAEVVIFHERMTSVPLEQFGAGEMQAYGNYIAETFLTGQND
ncbi:MAG: Nif3-like dinuclear metal center hexameric protein [Clostridia bacterium]|nr:Nif3-like dinuclear metal center hexameric protein [Clostridia bacterium]